VARLVTDSVDAVERPSASVLVALSCSRFDFIHAATSEMQLTRHLEEHELQMGGRSHTPACRTCGGHIENVCSIEQKKNRFSNGTLWSGTPKLASNGVELVLLHRTDC